MINIHYKDITLLQFPEEGGGNLLYIIVFLTYLLIDLLKFQK